jgi:hypothetical protein
VKRNSVGNILGGHFFFVEEFGTALVHVVNILLIYSAYIGIVFVNQRSTISVKKIIVFIANLFTFTDPQPLGTLKNILFL